jgi:hypothetical protein
MSKGAANERPQSYKSAYFAHVGPGFHSMPVQRFTTMPVQGFTACRSRLTRVRDCAVEGVARQALGARRWTRCLQISSTLDPDIYKSVFLVSAEGEAQSAEGRSPRLTQRDGA